MHATRFTLAGVRIGGDGAALSAYDPADRLGPEPVTEPFGDVRTPPVGPLVVVADQRVTRR